MSLGRVLIVDDDADLCELLSAGLESNRYEVEVMSSGSAALERLIETDFDVVITDINMPGMNGIEFCDRAVANRPAIPVLVMTAFASLESAIAAIRAGAEDFITKPIRVDALAVRIEHLLRNRSLRAEVKRLTEVVERDKSFGRLLGSSPAMKKVYDLLDRISDSEASVLITGESGTGKEVVARTLHERGKRADGPFVAINCSAVPQQLLESELFGHVRGAFTDAHMDRPGLFQRASGGTLFLDELGDMPAAVQPKLLRALQERTVRPVGGAEEIPVDTRIIAATNRDLESAVDAGTFREDLFFRINVIHVQLPPLRARGRDVLVLAQHFLEHFAAQADKKINAFSASAAEKLLAFDWPGNVRQLQNCVERAVALARFEEIKPDDLPDKIRSYKRSHVIVTSDDPTELVPMEQVERRYIARVLEAVNGNKTMAAKVLGFDRKTLYRKLDRYDITYEPRDE
jgi:two-component system response regulator HydG